jgi:uncharacterized protein (UPF0332 family)
MPYAEDLVDVARGLANLDEGEPRQASLRRAVSTAYYAIFHLLVSEAASNWNRVELRPALGRVFEHGRMKSASTGRVASLKRAVRSVPTGSPEFIVQTNLLVVADAFLLAHEKREVADYDISREWSRDDVLILIETVAKAFESWDIVRNEPEAQAYLVSFLTKQVR